MQYESSDEIQVDAGLSGTVRPGPVAPGGQAGAAVSFGREAGGIFSPLAW